MTSSELLDYFTTEKHAAVLISAIGLSSAAFAIWLWTTRSAFRAMAWPLIVLGVAEVAIGAGLFIRTDPQVARLEEGLRSNRDATARSELARMGTVNRNFVVIQIVEVAILLIGLALALTLKSRHPGWSAAGMGLVLEAAVLLVFDLFAEHRALAYTSWLAGLR